MDDNATDFALTAQVRDEAAAIMVALIRLTGLTSHWSGIIELIPGAKFKGKKHYGCAISLNASLAQQDIRWRTIIHESLHALSAGFNRVDYQEFVGWEEGVVEQLQRLLRQKVLAELHVIVEEQVFQQQETEHFYNRYIDVLEDLRKDLGSEEPVMFYLRLISTPIKNSPAIILDLGRRLAPSDYQRLVRRFSAANKTLKAGDPFHVTF